MKWDFNVVDYDHVLRAEPGILNNRTDPTFGLRAMQATHKIDRIKCQPEKKYAETKSVIEIDSANRTLAYRYRDIRLTTPAITPSIFNLNELEIIGTNGLLLDLENRICIVGESFGWHPDFAKWWSEANLNASWSSDRKEFTVDRNFETNRRTIHNQAIISQPGQDIYGHWILDIVPRLFLLNEAGLGGKEILIGQIPDWASFFIKNACPPGSSITAITDPNTIVTRRAYLPGFLKQGTVLDRDFCARAWKSFLTRVQTTTTKSSTPGPRKLFISRSKWSANRIIENEPDIEHSMQDRGYTIVYPETLSVEDQYQTFRNADIIVGQDGSGLHNIIFCEKPGVKLGVIGTTDRTNMWHISICDALDHKVAFMNAEKSIFGGETVKLERLNEFIDSVEAA
jgi:hypothetical protein